jgi:anti-sigma factor RsiW
VNEVDCRRVRNLLPERVRGALDASVAATVDVHLTSCAACREEQALVRLIERSSADTPEAIAGRIRSALREARVGAGSAALREGPNRAGTGGSRQRVRLAWALAAAATAVLALGTGVALERRGGPTEAELWQSFLEESPPPWVADDGLVAGAPLLDDLSALSDEDLALVLEELGG